MKNIMKKAWEIYRTLTGDHIAKLSMALRMAWQEVKKMVKETFNGFAKVIIPGRENCSDDESSKFLTLKSWNKNSISRIYLNDYKRRTIGYIDVENHKFSLIDNCGLRRSEIDSIVSEFMNTYEF